MTVRLAFVLCCVLCPLPGFGPVRAQPLEAGPPATTQAPDPSYSAAFVAQTVPPFIELFRPVAVSVTMRNTGTATWFRSDGDVFLATQGPQDNYFWCIQDNPHGMYRGNRVLLPYDVPPGEDVTFDFVVEPLTCGFAATAPFRFRMLSQMHGTFGEASPDAEVHVSTAAEFTSQQAPDAAPASASIGVTVTYRNTTNTTWRPSDGYALGSAGPTANTRWGTSSVALAREVAPGALARFSFVIEVPDVPATYNFQWQMNSAGNVPFGQTSPATAIRVVAPGPPNYQGLWWASPAGKESGWGINVAHQEDVLFATWFTYDANGNALWLSMTAERTPTGTYAGPLIRTTGPAFDVARFRPDFVRSVAVGSGTLSFDANDGGTFAYTLNGIARSKSIVRQAFGPLPTCTFALEPDLTRAYNYQDIWWAAPAESEPGWGMSLTHQGETIFGTWFTYDRDGSPMWLSFTAPKTADAPAATYSGTLYGTTGPPFNTVPFDPARVVATKVGTAALAFSNGNAAAFSYSVDGIDGSESMTRQIFRTPGTVCQ